MRAEDLHDAAARRAEELPGAELTHPFGDEWDVFKVRGKVFMLHTLLRDEPLVIVKSAPVDALALRQAHPDISPGYHMNKRRWITLHAGGALDEAHLSELVTESYLLVVGGLRRDLRPVDPDLFARHTVDE